MGDARHLPNEAIGAVTDTCINNLLAAAVLQSISQRLIDM
jgi:hypothetical protein